MFLAQSTAAALNAEYVRTMESICTMPRRDLPFGRCDLLGDPSVLGYYQTSRQFIARTALAVFPAGLGKPAEIITGSLCDWRTPDVGRLFDLPNRLIVSFQKPFELHTHTLRYLQAARAAGELPEETYDESNDIDALEMLCTEHGWPSAVFTLETVENDTPENPKPERAALRYPLLAKPQVALQSLQRALFDWQMTN